MSECPATATSALVHRTETAVRHGASHLRFWITAGLFLGLDLGSKNWAFKSLDPHEARRVVPGVLEFRRSLNDGAVFGSLTGHVELFMAASFLALVFVVYLFGCSTRQQWVLHVALGMVLAGTLGNLYDRTFQIADIVTYQAPSGNEVSVIGLMISGSDDRFIRLGTWPEGDDPREFDRSAVQVRRQGVVRDFLKFTFQFPEWVPKLGRHDMWPWIFNVADAALVCGVGLLILGGRRAPQATGEAANS